MNNIAETKRRPCPHREGKISRVFFFFFSDLSSFPYQNKMYMTSSNFDQKLLSIQINVQSSISKIRTTFNKSFDMGPHALPGVAFVWPFM